MGCGIDRPASSRLPNARWCINPSVGLHVLGSQHTYLDKRYAETLRALIVAVGCVVAVNSPRDELSFSGLPTDDRLISLRISLIIASLLSV